jgi:lysophospholipase L1-like esterase
MGACTPAPLADEAGIAPGSLFTVPHRLAWLRSVQVYGPPRRSIAAFGDSITVSPQLPLHKYWSDVLLGHGVAIVNAGAGGSYLTTMGMYGTAIGLHRLQELLAEPGLSDVVLLIGTNDLAVGVSPAQFLNALAFALHDAQARQVRVWVCTILPRGGSGWTPSAEPARLAVNAVLRSSWLSQRGARLIDTDAALRDPAQPDRLLADFDSGDHLHPSVDGAYELGLTIELALGLLL